MTVTVMHQLSIALIKQILNKQHPLISTAPTKQNIALIRRK